MADQHYPGRWYHLLEDGRMQCDLCPRDCRLHEGQRGACFVRQRIGDEMVLTTYGRSSGFCIDPVEKKPLNHFYPGSSILSFGTAGCNLACKFCQNWDISKSRDMDRLADQATPEAIAIAAKQYGCKSVAFTYNDPVIFAEYAMDIADACREQGVQAVAVTAGYIHAEPRREFYAKMDAANVDLKAFTDEFYVKLCGAHLAPVLDTLAYLKHETNVWFEITTLLIPGKNDSDEELTAECRWIMKRARSRRAGAFHGVPPGSQDDRHLRDARRDAHARPPHRDRGRPALRLHRQRARQSGRLDVLLRMQPAVDRARLVSDRRLSVDSLGRLPRLRDGGSGSLRELQPAARKAPDSGGRLKDLVPLLRRGNWQPAWPAGATTPLTRGECGAETPYAAPPALRLLPRCLRAQRHPLCALRRYFIQLVDERHHH